MQRRPRTILVHARRVIAEDERGAVIAFAGSTMRQNCRPAISCRQVEDRTDTLSLLLLPAEAKAKLAGMLRERVDQHNTGSMQFERIERVIVERTDNGSDLPEPTNSQESW
jgi:hypothetical protein